MHTYQIIVFMFIVIFTLVIVMMIATSVQKAKLKTLIKQLNSSQSSIHPDISNSKLPAGPPVVVQRYFEHVILKHHGLIKSAIIQQSGHLRTQPLSGKWLAFDADQRLVPAATGFIWNAKIKLPFAMHLNVIDSYIEGKGAGRVSVQSALTLKSDSGHSKLNAGALHRYLGESVWVPTALLPESGVVWESINSQSAMAKLGDHENSVSLVFHFKKTGEIESVYTPG